MLFIARWKVLGAFVSPNGMRLNSNKPNSQMKAVLCLSASLISICQYPLKRSRVVKYRAPYSASIVSSILGNGNLSLIVILFSNL